MQLNDLEYSTTQTLAVGQSIFRVQRARAHPTTVRRGPLKLPPLGLMSGRFDVPGVATAYFALYASGNPILKPEV